MSDDSPDRLDKLVLQARSDFDARADGYRQRALKLYPWICGRCMREFDRTNLSELTVHHRDHNHDNNPHDGSNWELLCLYCHDNEHQRLTEMPTSNSANAKEPSVTHNPFSDLKAIMQNSNGGASTDDVEK